MVAVRKRLGATDRRAKVILTIPYPDPRNSRFGPVGGRWLDLSRQADRVEAIRWYVQRALEQWRRREQHGRLAGARLVGFYWGCEGLRSYRGSHGMVTDAELIRKTADCVHKEDLLFHWIPCFGCAKVFDRYPLRTLGFDCITQQINYQNPQRPGRPLSIFEEQTAVVEKYGLHGVEMTPMARESPLNPRVWSWHQVFLANLDAALRYRWERFPAITYFHGNSLCQIGADPKTRPYYAQLAKWIHGELTPTDVRELCDRVVAELKARGALSETALRHIADADTVLEKLQWMERPIESVGEVPISRERIGVEWVSVAADDADNESVRRYRPGVCFLGNGEWAPPKEHDGRIARFGGHYPGQGGPNFLINDPPQRELELRLSYWTEFGGTVRVYDGRRYHRLAELTARRRWATLSCRVRGSLLKNPAADRPEPGWNILCEIDSKGVYVEKIEVRALQRTAVSERARAFSDRP